MRVAILGGPGSGKGTQAKILAERYRVPQVSIEDLLQEAASNDENLSIETKDSMAEGKQVDEEVVLKLLEERLRKKDTKRGYIIDGYPKNIPQAQALDTLLGMLGKTLQIAINIDVAEDILVKRVVGKLNCAECGSIYNRYFLTPSKKNKCDACDENLIPQVGDTTKTARLRVDVYRQETIPLITYYRAQHKLRTMAGAGAVDEIHQKLCDLVDLEIRPLEIKSLETAADLSEEKVSTIIAGGQINRIEIETTAKRQNRKKKKTATTTIKRVAKKSVTKKKKVAKVAKSKTKKKTVTKSITKKPAAKKLSSKKTVTKKPVSKKTKLKKVAAKSSTKKKTRKKAPLKKSVTKKKKVAKVAKSKTKKKTVTKSITKKPAAKKLSSKKTVTKKPVSKKTKLKKVAAKSSTKKKTRKKAPLKKSVAKKPASKKTTRAKSTSKKKITKKATKPPSKKRKA